MKAVTIYGKEDVRVEAVADPKIKEPTDVVARVTASAICGSDLHQYHWRFPNIEPGSVMGHEFVGVVEEVGPAVSRVKKGDRIMAPFSISCGTCDYCLERLPAQCATTGRAVFGGRFGKIYPGGQAQFIRIPFADFMCESIPKGMSDEKAIFLGDILSTGYFAAENGGIRPGDTVAVFGCGPVGLFAIQAARLFGPSRVFAVDRVGYRLEMAESFGATPVDGSKGDQIERLKRETGGRGVHVALECVGQEPALIDALRAVKAGGTVSVVGVYAEPSFPFPIGDAFFRDLSLKIGICNARNYIRQLLPLVEQGKIDPVRIITHRIPLKDAPEGYRIFDRKEDRAIKVVLQP